MIKGFYVNKDKSVTIINHVYPKGAEIYIARYRSLDNFILLLREVVKDADEARMSYLIPFILIKENRRLESPIRNLGFQPETKFVSQYWYRKPANHANEPYEIVSGHYNRDDVLIVNNKIEGGVLDDLYVIRNLYKDVLFVTDSLLEAERYMKS